MSAQPATRFTASEPAQNNVDGHSPRRHLVAVPPLVSSTSVTQPANPDEKLLLSIATQSFQVIEGKRNVTHLGPLISMAAARSLALQHSLLRERNATHQAKVRNIIGAGKARVCRISENVAEATVTLHSMHRSHAVAIRVELLHGRWRATEITVL